MTNHEGVKTILKHTQDHNILYMKWINTESPHMESAHNHFHRPRRNLMKNMSLAYRQSETVRATRFPVC